jgi:hypothetical protein
MGKGRGEIMAIFDIAKERPELAAELFLKIRNFSNPFRQRTFSRGTCGLSCRMKLAEVYQRLPHVSAPISRF